MGFEDHKESRDPLCLRMDFYAIMVYASVGEREREREGKGEREGEKVANLIALTVLSLMV